MQVIAVERWTFWSAVVVAVLGPVLAAGFGMLSISSGNSTVTTGFGGTVTVLVFALLVVSVYLGGTRDPSVRRLPAQPEP
jgi:hypothetical protein